jgi:hypothetical protein
MGELPKIINVMKVVSYDVQQIAEDIMAEEEVEAEAITLERVLERLDLYVQDDFDTDKDYLLYQDENGNEIND